MRRITIQVRACASSTRPSHRILQSGHAQQHRKLSAYEKELIGLMKAIRNWRTYSWGNFFIIRTGQYSLKFLLELRITTSPQQQWINKLMGLDFRVEYKPGRSNIVVDVLSLQDEPPYMSLNTLYIP